MVKIVKGDSQLTVTRGAFHNFYEAQGYQLLEAPEAPVDPEFPAGGFNGGQDHSPDSEPAATSETYTQEQLMSMTTNQLYEVADQLGINYQRVRTKNDLVRLIVQASQ